MQINRLFEIVYILMNKKITTAKELCEHFEVSQRTIYRDIESLCQAGIPIYTTKGKGGGIGLMENFVLNKSVLTNEEQNEILSALQGLKATSFTETDQILSKLNSLFGNKNTDWIEVDFSNWSSKDEDKMKFRQLKDAILNHKLIHFKYFNSYGKESDRSVEPYKLIFRGQAWYLYCFCMKKKSMRYFKITRMVGLTISKEDFHPASHVKSEDEIINKHDYPSVNLIMKVDSEMAFRIFDEFGSEAITRNQDGSFLVNARVNSDNWLISYLMSFEDHIEVIQPTILRNQLLEKYKKAMLKYDTLMSD